MTDGRRNETLIFVVLFIHEYTYRCSQPKYDVY